MFSVYSLCKGHLFLFTHPAPAHSPGNITFISFRDTHFPLHVGETGNQVLCSSRSRVGVWGIGLGRLAFIHAWKIQRWRVLGWEYNLKQGGQEGPFWDLTLPETVSQDRPCSTHPQYLHLSWWHCYPVSLPAKNNNNNNKETDTNKQCRIIPLSCSYPHPISHRKLFIFESHPESDHSSVSAQLPDGLKPPPSPTWMITTAFCMISLLLPLLPIVHSQHYSHRTLCRWSQLMSNDFLKNILRGPRLAERRQS